MTWSTNQSAADTAITVDLPARAGGSYRIYAIYYSYAGGTVVGTLELSEGGTRKFFIDITATGPNTIPFPPYQTQSGKAVQIVLDAGGAAVVGSLNILYSEE